MWHDCFYLRHKQKLLILSRLNDFMTCSAHFNIQSEWSISQLWNTVGRYNLEYTFIRHSCIQSVNNVTRESFCNL